MFMAYIDKIINIDQFKLINIQSTNVNRNIFQIPMGFGKSTIIIPYILYSDNIKYKYTIFVTINNKLKLDILSNINNIVFKDIILHSVDSISEKFITSDIVNGDSIFIQTYEEIKYLMYKLPEFYNILSHKNTLVIIDEVDSFLNASKCELLIQNKFINIDKNSIDLYLPIIFDYYYDDTKTEYADNVYDRLYNLLKICKYNYKINKDYGVINSFECALPFDYVGVPNSKNNFTDPLLTIITTAFAYYQKKE